MSDPEGAHHANPFVRVRWHRRFGVRLTVALWATLVLFDLLSGSLVDLALIVLRHPTRDVTIFWGPDPDVESRLARGLADALVTGADGAPPSRETVETLAASLAVRDERFALLDGSGRIVASSDPDVWPTGSSWTLSERSHVIVPLGGVHLHSTHVETGDGGTFVHLTRVLDDELDEPFCPYDDATALGGDVKAVFMDEQSYAALVAREQRIARVLSLAFAALLAIVVAAFVTRVAIRPLSHLVQQVSRRPALSDGLPGPFEEQGSDEFDLLARALNRMRARVVALLEGLASKDAGRRDWIAQVSHDLRTPLTALMACLDRAERALDGPRASVDVDELRRLLDVARLDADRVRTLADDLLEIARLEAGDALVLEPVPAGELARQAVTALSPLAEQRAIELELSVEPGLALMTADGRRLMRALENLLRNALQHAASAVTVVVRGADDMIRFEVLDDGPGFDSGPGAIGFDALAGSRSREDSAGLGLVVTERVARAHAGSVGAVNLEDGGAAVWFAIPADLD